MKISLLLSGLLSAASLAAAQANGTIYSGAVPEELNGSNFTYPWPVKLFRFSSQMQDLEMAFMDVPPTCKPNGRTALMFHGKNFCGPTWEDTIRVLTGKGYRVIAADQVGFCKSSKPDNYQFSLQQLGWNTKGLLNALGLDKVTVIGHSLGGMLTARFGLDWPDTVHEMVMVDAVGLEDYMQKGVPYISIDQSRQTELASTYASIKGYEQATYYAGTWNSSYDTWVQMLVNIYYGPEREAYCKNQAQIVDLVLTQPVAHYFKDIKPRTLIMVGDKDNTAIGGTWSPPAVAAKLGHFNKLGPLVASEIPHSTLVQFPDDGHAPFLSSPDQFYKALLGWLSK